MKGFLRVALCCAPLMFAHADEVPVDQIQRLMGYGGFIHGFKNYVLRGEEEMLTQAELDLNQVLSIIQPLAQTDPNAQRVLVTLNAYQDAIEEARQLKRQGLPPEQIDDAVRVSDLDALKALGRLELEHANRQRMHSIQQTWIQGAGLLSIGAALFLAGLAHSYRRKLNGLTDQVNHANSAQHHFDRTLMTLNDLNDTEGLGFFEAEGKIIRQATSLARLMQAKQAPTDRDMLLKLFPIEIRKALKNHLSDVQQFATPKSVILKHEEKQFRLTLEPVAQSQRVLGVVQRLVPVSRKELVKAQQVTEQIATDRAGRIKRLTAGLREAKEQLASLEQAAHKDPLTDLYNRLGFGERLRAEVQRARRKNETLGVLMVDVDKFKRVNDEFGHAVGDQALKLVADTLQRLVRSEGGDIVGRLGGDEFIVVLADATAEHASRTLKMAKTLLADEIIPQCPDESIRVMISGGAVTLNPEKDEPGEVIKLADAALYKEKEQHHSFA